MEFKIDNWFAFVRWKVEQSQYIIYKTGRDTTPVGKNKCLYLYSSNMVWGLRHANLCKLYMHYLAHFI